MAATTTLTKTVMGTDTATVTDGDDLVSPDPVQPKGMQLLRILQLASPTLPVGAYAYSQGMENAIDRQWLTDAASTQAWIIGVMRHSLARVDLPIFSRLYTALLNCQADEFDYWNEYLLASRESRELENEDLQLANALLQLLSDLGVESATARIDRPTSFAGAFVLASVHWNIDLENALAAFLWSWTDNQVAAAIKLVPLGQTAGQKILVDCMTHIPQAIRAALDIKDDEIGFSAPALAIGSAHHETQYSRLFRS